MKLQLNKDDVLERSPGKRGRVNLSESDTVQKAQKEGKKVEVAVLGVVEDDE